MEQQVYHPAQKMFIFQRGWQVLSNTSSRIMQTAQAVFGLMSDQASELSDWADKNRNLGSLFALIFAFCYLVLGCAAFVLLGLVALLFASGFATLLLFLMAGALLIIGLLNLASWSYSRYFGIYYRCPTIHCYHEMAAPIYKCKECWEPHSALQPGLYGIFFHRCSCEKKLPTLDLLGRSKLERYCAHCGIPLDKEIGRATNIDIPIIGGPSSGKTTYLVSATSELKNRYERDPHSYTITLTTKHYQQNFENNLFQLQQGKPLAKTVDEAPAAYSLKIVRPRMRIPKLLFFYDAAGEAFSSDGKIRWHTYYKYIRGLVFIIDPCSISAFRRNHQQDIARLGDALAPSTLDIEEIGHRLIRAIETYRGAHLHKPHKVPIAIVVTKVDALNLENEIGQLAAQQRAHANGLSLEEARELVVKEFLWRNGLNNLLDQLEHYFSPAHYFSCSSLGSMPMSLNYHFAPIRALEPLEWLLVQNKVFKTYALTT